MTTVCSVNPRFGFEAVDRYIGTAAGESKKVAVIGGGPGGMRTALYLADRGHRVTIFEAQDKLGGAIKHADYVPFKWTLKAYKDYLIRQVEKKHVQARDAGRRLRRGCGSRRGRTDCSSDPRRG